MPSRIRKTYKSVFLCVMCTTLFACAAPTVKQSVLMPANADVMKNSKKIAVVGFHGDRNEEFTRKVESFFSAIRVKNSPYFSVVDHSSLKVILADHFVVPDELLKDAAKLSLLGDIGSILSAVESLTSSVKLPGLGSLSPKTPKLLKVNTATPDVPQLPRVDTPSYVFRIQDALKLGSLSGADTIITGAVKWPPVRYSYYQEERSNCVKYADKKTGNALTPGFKSKKCLKYAKTKVQCTKQYSKVEYVIKAVSVANNEIAFTKDYAGQAENKYCKDDKYKEAMDPTKLSAKAIDNAIGKMRHDVAPYVVVLTIQLMDKDDSKLADSKEAQKILESGLAFAKKGRLDRACDFFRQAAQMYDQSPALYYNLGVCAEIKNDLEGASKLYKQADGLVLKPNKLINTAIFRIDDRKLKAARVASQLH